MDEEYHQSHIDDDHRISALSGPRRSFRQHRRGTVLHHRRSGRIEDVRLPCHRERLCRGHRLREVLEREEPAERSDPQCLDSDDHDPGLEDARRGADGRSRTAVARGIHEREPGSSGKRALQHDPLDRGDQEIRDQPGGLHQRLPYRHEAGNRHGPQVRRGSRRPLRPFRALAQGGGTAPSNWPMS